MVLLVRSETLKSVFLNKFVMNVVFLLKYVKEAHLCVVVPIWPYKVVVGFCGWEFVCVCGLGNRCLT